MAAVLTLPFRNDLPWYKFKTTFSGTAYLVHVRFNVRMQRYLMDLNDAGDNPILVGIPVLISRNLTAQYPTLAVPPGIFVAKDDTGKGTQPTQFSFGVDHTMFYIDPDQ